MLKALAIVGTHPRTRGNAPWNSKDTDLWLLNEAGNSDWVKGRIDGLLQIHARAIYRSESNKTDKDHWEWLQQEHPFPIFMQNVDPLVLSSVEYPLKKIQDDLLINFVDGLTGKPFSPFTNSVSYCIALALYLGYWNIEFYGIEMESNTEYSYQRENVAFWTGLAVGHGARVEMHCAQEYYSGPMYGYEGSISLDPQEYIKDFEQLQEAARARKELVNDLKHQDNIDAFGAIPGFLVKRQALLDALGNQGLADGLISEAERYHAKAVQKITESGMAIIARTEFEINAAAAKINADSTRAKLAFDSGRCHYIWDIWCRDRLDLWLEEFRRYSENQFENSYEIGRLIGIEQYNRIYMQLMDEKIQAAGGQRAMAALIPEAG